LKFADFIIHVCFSHIRLCLGKIFDHFLEIFEMCLSAWNACKCCTPYITLTTLAAESCLTEAKSTKSEDTRTTLSVGRASVNISFDLLETPVGQYTLISVSLR
jgi:hypothetical protein